MTLADVLFILLSAAPVPTTPGATETRAEQLTRLRSIAEDVAVIGRGEQERRNVRWRGRSARSTWARAGAAKRATASMWQIHGGSSAFRAFANRREAARVALAALKSSSATCRKLPKAEQFTAYASGGCSSEAGKRGSRELFAAWSSWAQKYRVEMARREEQKP